MQPLSCNRRRVFIFLSPHVSRGEGHTILFSSPHAVYGERVRVKNIPLSLFQRGEG